MVIVVRLLVQVVVMQWHDNVLELCYSLCFMIKKIQHLLIFQYFVIVVSQIDLQFLMKIQIHGNGSVCEFYDEIMTSVVMMLGHVVMVLSIRELIQYHEFQ